MKDTREELSDLWSFLNYGKSLSGVGLTLSALFPTAATALPDVIPPWPSGIGYLSSALSALCALIFFLIHRRSAREQLRFLRRWLLFGALGCSVAYLLILARYVERIDKDLYVVTGFALTEEAKAEVTHGVSPTPRELLATFGYASADRIWKWRFLAKALLCLTFLGTFALLSSGLTLVIMQNMHEDGLLGGSPLPAREPTGASTKSPPRNRN